MKLYALFIISNHPNHYHTPHFAHYATSLPNITEQAGQANAGIDYHEMSLFWNRKFLLELQKATNKFVLQ